MNLALHFKRWRALRGVQPLVADSREGTVVRATGIARAGAHAEPFVPPLAGVLSVVAWTKFVIPNTTQHTRTPPAALERLLIRPFVLETDDLDVIVDGSHVELLLPMRSEGNMSEISVADGAEITVIGTLLRDGIARPEGDFAFREEHATCKLVGNRAHPIVITASVSDKRAS